MIVLFEDSGNCQSSFRTLGTNQGGPFDSWGGVGGFEKNILQPSLYPKIN